MLFKNLRIHQIFGANTEVGKTLFATALCRTSAQNGEASHYLKPVGTGGHGDDWYGNLLHSQLLVMLIASI
jgi:dethiobiotin synthetase/adenosylmethionine--8-amino-7-oxononanoate aminotransferase